MTLKDAKLNFVIDIATALFLERSVSSVTIKDIAKASGLGEATIYRYFSGRGELLVACALKLQEKVGSIFIDGTEGLSGFARIEKFYKAYLSAFRESPELYRFLYEFDAYCISEKLTGLEEYADNMDAFREAFLSAYRDGVADGSVKEICDPSLFYFSTAHALLSLCKKLAVEGALLRQDESLDKGAEIGMMIDVILASLRA
ncbi:MAG: helix-turn-helix transcriptional regulator [Clostridia bacterium]|nr:helix-turn-helix transcriptional regulator [Clostridia bacterium]